MTAKTWVGAVALAALLKAGAPLAWADAQGPSAHVLGGAPQTAGSPPADWCPASVPPDTAGVDRNAAAIAGTPFGQMNIAATTQWQPVGGEVQFSIGNVEAQPEHVRVYFAWADSLRDGPAKTCARSPSVRFVGVSSKGATAYIYAARVPGELGSAPGDGPVDGWSHRTKWWSLVPPPALVFVSAVVPANGSTPATPILLDRLVGITTSWIAFVMAVGLLLIGWWVLAWWADKRGLLGGALLRIISTPRGSASLSQFQILIWTAVIGTGVTYVMLLSGNLIDVPDTTLALLGVTGAALVGSKLTGEPGQNTGAGPRTAPVTPDPAVAAPAKVTNLRACPQPNGSVELAWSPLQPPPDAYVVQYREAGAPTWSTADPVMAAATTLSGLRSGWRHEFQVLATTAGRSGPPSDLTFGATATRMPKWSDMVMGGQLDVEIDLGRLQMLVFTTIAAAFTALTLVNIGQIPDIPTGELGLVGLSNGIYLAHKMAQRGR